MHLRSGNEAKKYSIPNEKIHIILEDFYVEEYEYMEVDISDFDVAASNLDAWEQFEQDYNNKKSEIDQIALSHVVELAEYQAENEISYSKQNCYESLLEQAVLITLPDVNSDDGEDLIKTLSNDINMELDELVTFEDLIESAKGIKEDYEW